MSDRAGGDRPPPLPPPPAPTRRPVVEARAFTGRAAYSIGQIYYYAAAVVGVAFVVGGTIGALIGARELVLPSDAETTRAAVRSILQGVAWAVPGLLFARWHLREARSREGSLVPGAFWGRSLYFHLVSFVAGVTVLGGTTAALYAVVDAALPPTCLTGPVPLGVDVSGVCRDATDALRAGLNAAIVILVAGAVWWWHLREARRTPVAAALPT